MASGAQASAALLSALNQGGAIGSQAIAAKRADTRSKERNDLFEQQIAVMERGADLAEKTFKHEKKLSQQMSPDMQAQVRMANKDRALAQQKENNDQARLNQQMLLDRQKAQTNKANALNMQIATESQSATLAIEEARFALMTAKPEQLAQPGYAFTIIAGLQSMGPHLMDPVSQLRIRLAAQSLGTCFTGKNAFDGINLTDVAKQRTAGTIFNAAPTGSAPAPGQAPGAAAPPTGTVPPPAAPANPGLVDPLQDMYK